MPLPRLPGLGVEKILFSEEFVCEAIAHFFCFHVEGCNQCLGLLGCADWSLCLDGDNRGVGRRSLGDSCVLLRAESCDVPLLIALEAESALNSLPFFFVRECGTRPGSSYVHGVWVLIIECVPPLEFCCSTSPFPAFDPLFEVNVFLLVATGCSCPIIPCDWVIELYAVGN